MQYLIITGNKIIPKTNKNCVEHYVCHGLEKYCTIENKDQNEMKVMQMDIFYHLEP